MSALLPRAIGVRRAREMTATGNFISALTAHEFGLVNHVVAHDELLAHARRLADDIAGADRAAVRRSLELYDQATVRPWPTPWDWRPKPWPAGRGAPNAPRAARRLDRPRLGAATRPLLPRS